MALTPQYSRISHHAITTAGATFHVPLGEDFTIIGGTLSWNVTGIELADREFGINTTDNKVYLRIGSNINELLFVGGTGNDQSFAETLAINNNSQTYNVIMGTSTYIGSVNGSGRIELDNSGGPGVINISNDGGAFTDEYLYLSNGYIELSSFNTGAQLLIQAGDVKLDMIDGSNIGISSANMYVKLDETTKSFDVKGMYNGSGVQGVIYVRDNATVNMSSGNTNKPGTIIGSKNSTIGTASYNTVVIGGDGINATTTNSVYVPDLYIQTAKSIKSTNGGGQIELDSTANGGGPGSIYLSTDNGGYAETGMFLEPGGNGAYIYSYDGGIVLETNQSGISFIESGASSGQLRVSSSWLSVINDAIFVKDNLVTSVTASNTSKVATMISSQNSSFASAINNSVILGGNNQRVSTSNTVSINHRQFLFASASNGTAGTTTLASISMADGQTITITAIVNARCTSPDRNLGAKLTAVFLKYGGTIYQTSTTDDITKDGFGDKTTATIDTDGTNVRIRITNGTGLTTNWYSSYDYLLTY